MYWYKVKNVLIILFAAINIFLIATIVIGNVEKNREEQRISDSLIKVLENSNVKINGELISTKAPKLNTKQVENFITQDTDFASLILGGKAAVKFDGDGVLYYGFEEDKLYLANSRLHYYNSSFSGSGDTDAATVEKADAALRKIGLPMEDYRGELNGDTVIFTLYIDGVPFFGNNLNVKLFNGQIGELWGYIIKNTAFTGTPASIRSTADVLLEFLQEPARGTESITVTALELGYSILEQGSNIDFKTADAVPTYRIQTDKGQIFYYDARKN
ncbi:MAG: hypothetical protein IJT38_03510 [Clostridia bacterium]|nr:hypothetical protein [Clostridia bacterium]